MNIIQLLQCSLSCRYEKSSKGCPDPISSRFSLNRDFGAITEKLESVVHKHIVNRDLSEKEGGKFEELIAQKSMTSQADPGEPVGILAAQVFFLLNEP